MSNSEIRNGLFSVRSPTSERKASSSIDSAPPRHHDDAVGLLCRSSFDRRVYMASRSIAKPEVAHNRIESDAALKVLHCLAVGARRLDIGHPTWTRELLAWNEATTAASTSDPAIQAQILQQTERAIDSLQLLNRTVELLKGDEWSGFLVFNLGTEPDVYTTIMHSVERFKLRLAEFPVETDDAGQVTRTTEFTFSIEKTTKEVDAECPGGTGDTVVGCVQAGRCTPVDAGTVAEIRGRVQKLVAGEAPGGFVSKILGRELGL